MALKLKTPGKEHHPGLVKGKMMKNVPPKKGVLLWWFLFEPKPDGKMMGRSGASHEFSCVCTAWSVVFECLLRLAL